MSATLASPVLNAAGDRLARITVEQYHKMIEAGAFAHGDRIELLEGYLVEKMTKNPPHRFALGELDDILRNLVPQGWHVANQDSITLDNSEPEPDLAIIQGRRSDYKTGHPMPPDVGLVVEVAESSLVTDRLKAETYARNQIVEYWIVNLVDRCIEVHESPAADASGHHYINVSVYQPSDSVPFTLAGTTIGSIQVDDILP